MNDSAPTLFSVLPYLMGGVGLFLTGMILMSDGLKAAAGGSLQNVLERWTRTTPAAFLFGVGLTALLQSSSATTITTIGFVSAGLLAFTSAIGVIIGANVGTTSTGWIVALLGFKLNVGTIALPFIGVGAVLWLLGNGRRAQFGMALVGFGLIFVGIEFLQEGMGGLAQNIDMSGLSQKTLLDHIALVLLGALMTVLLQSSSAAIALSLTALHSGAIGLEQAAYLVIGQNLGTTVKAVLAAIGATIAAQRTAVAHILFNLVTAVLAFIFARYLLALSVFLSSLRDTADPSVALAIFHTIFNLLGAIIFLPFVAQFGRYVVRLVPERGPRLTRHLDKSLLNLPHVAVEAAARALQEITTLTMTEAIGLLRQGAQTRQMREQLWAAQAAMSETSQFLGKIRFGGGREAVFDRRLALLHAGDHVDRLIEACLESESPIYGADAQTAAQQLADELATAVSWLQTPTGEAKDLIRHLKKASSRQAKSRRAQRATRLEETAAGLIQPDEAQRQLESMRWVDRIGYHTWRAFHHLAGSPALAETLETAVYEEPEAVDN
ncbi:MAG: Na/Pi cotransporter family protein [Chloroflexi bacterium]|nr:Na/Pi cotransporter family protein [Chloroflexota bacterium]